MWLAVWLSDNMAVDGWMAAFGWLPKRSRRKRKQIMEGKCPQSVDSMVSCCPFLDQPMSNNQLVSEDTQHSTQKTKGTIRIVGYDIRAKQQVIFE